MWYHGPLTTGPRGHVGWPAGQTRPSCQFNGKWLARERTVIGDGELGTATGARATGPNRSATLRSTLRRQRRYLMVVGGDEDDNGGRRCTANHGEDKTGPCRPSGPRKRGERGREEPRAHPGDDGGGGEARGSSRRRQSSMECGRRRCSKRTRTTRRGNPRKNGLAET